MLKKIGIKLIILIALTSLIAIGIFAYFNIQSESRSLLAEVERHANQLSETVKYSIRYDMLLNQRDRIHKIINTIAEHETINDVRILNKEGRIIYSSHSSEINKMVDKKTESCYACHQANKPLEKLSIKEKTRIFRPNKKSPRIMGIINPIYNEKTCWLAGCHAHTEKQTVLGVLDVTISLDEVDKQIKKNEINIAVFAVSVIIILSIFTGIFIKKWVDEPVNSLLKATDQVGLGNFNYNIETQRKDELGKLADAFNKMTSKLSKAREQILQSDKMSSLGRMAAGVAHEINNPLTGILTYSSFLLKRAKNNPELEEDLKVIVRETMRSREIVKSLLDFARQSVPKKTSANINDIITKSIKILKNQLTIDHVKVVPILDKNIPEITVDSNQLQQVFINLIVNAKDAVRGSGGEINISTSRILRSPLGIAQIRNARCPKNHSLMDDNFKIDGNPSIKFIIKYNGIEKLINLDPIYGRQCHKHEFEIKPNINVEFLCPQCKISLNKQKERCPICNSSVYSFEILGEGIFKGCIKNDCGWENWDFIESGGKKEYIEIRISDNGDGISKENISKIFEPFFSTKGNKGTGLGLAVVWGIIDNHKGSINVESNVSKGTTFIIRLPIN